MSPHGNRAVTCGHFPFDWARLLISSTVFLREAWSDRDTNTGRMYFIRAGREGAALVWSALLLPREVGRDSGLSLEGPHGRTTEWAASQCLTTRALAKPPKLPVNRESMQPYTSRASKATECQKSAECLQSLC